jgi:UPF0755 protein
MNKKIIFALIFAGPLLGLTFVAIHLSIILFNPYDGPDLEFIIKPGEGFSSVNYRLSKREIISNPRVFHYYSKLTNSLDKLKAGRYEISQGMNMPEILDLFVNGVPLLISVTIPEGKNMYEIGKILEKKKVISYKDFIKEAKSSNYQKLIGAAVHSVEGYLYPETYMFAPQSSAGTVIKAMIQQFKRATKGLDFSGGKLNMHQTITLASIVEKETGAAWERPRIAGVFHNRLRKRMRLQSDPTTIYGIYETFNGNLTKKHLLTKTPYNTYKIPALPKGPICNPGIKAIKATLEPEQHPYLYFVSKNDGTHIFTETYKKHREAVNHWQKNPNNRKGKSWRDLKKKN